MFLNGEVNIACNVCDGSNMKATYVVSAARSWKISESEIYKQ
jgi:hypothetical protein